MTVSNREFLRHIFRNRQDGAVFVSSVPDHRPGKYTGSSLLDESRLDQYFCISSVHGNRRRSQDWAEMHCLVIDDVGVKVTSTEVATTLGHPSYTVITSKGSAHWGYCFDAPVRDRALAEGLSAAACRAFDLRDMAGVNRLMRLPVGTNTKRRDYGVHLAQWKPERTFKPADLLEALGGELLYTHTGTTVENVSPPDKDPIIVAVVEHGLLKTKAPRNGHIWDITCPWVHEHTDAVDTGAAYLAPDGFACHHDSCAGRDSAGKKVRGFRAFREWLEVPSEAVEDARADAFAGAVDTFVGSLSEAEPQRIALPVEVEPEPPQTNGHTDWPEEEEEEGSELDRRVGRSNVIARWIQPEGGLVGAPKREWLVENLIPAHVPGLLIGTGGMRKGFLLQSLALHLALGQTFAKFAISQPRHVLYVSREDDDPELQRRFDATFEAHWGQPTAEHYAALLDRYDVVDLVGVSGIALKAGGLFLTAIAERAQERGSELIVLDPLGQLRPRTGSDLNSAEFASETHDALGWLAAQTGAAVLLVHHTNKEGMRRGKLQTADSTGTGQLTDLARFVIGLQPDPGEGSDHVELVSLKATYGDTRWGRVAFRPVDGGALLYDPAHVSQGSIEEQMMDALHEATFGGVAVNIDEWTETVQAQGSRLTHKEQQHLRQKLEDDGLVSVERVHRKPPLYRPSDVDDVDQLFT